MAKIVTKLDDNTIIVEDVLAVGVHYQSDTIGSRQIATK